MPAIFAPPAPTAQATPGIAASPAALASLPLSAPSRRGTATLWMPAPLAQVNQGWQLGGLCGRAPEGASASLHACLSACLLCSHLHTPFARKGSQAVLATTCLNL